jgi:hypothetical protein
MTKVWKIKIEDFYHYRHFLFNEQESINSIKRGRDCSCWLLVITKISNMLSNK